MAISHSHLILFLPLFFLPTWGYLVDYFDCDGLVANYTSVEISEDKGVASLKISGVTTKSVNGGLMDVTVKVGLIVIMKRTYKLCEYMTCSPEPGYFLLTVGNMFRSYPGVNYDISLRADSDSEEEYIMCLDIKFQASIPNAVSE